MITDEEKAKVYEAFEILTRECYGNAVERGFHDVTVNRTFGDECALFTSEISEAYEDYRAGKPFDQVYYEVTKPCGIPIEIADLLIRIFDTVGARRIPLASAVIEKMAYNRSRPYRHGNKIV